MALMTIVQLGDLFRYLKYQPTLQSDSDTVKTMMFFSLNTLQPIQQAHQTRCFKPSPNWYVHVPAI